MPVKLPIGLRIFKLFLLITEWLLAPYFWYKARTQKIKIPPTQDALLKSSATNLADMIRNKQVTSVKLVSTYINRIKEVNPIINAVVEDRFDAALQEAAAVDRYLESGAINLEEVKRKKPLLGVPVTVKESCGVAGCSFSIGSLSRKGLKCKEDGEPVAKLKASGAIPIAVTNTPELGLLWETTNYVTGTTNNPYNTNCTAGGPSGGEGALIAAAGSILGLGSDFLGPSGIPAAFNGIFSHKPSSGLSSLKGHFPYTEDPKFNRAFTTDVYARYSEDLKLMFDVIIGSNKEKLHVKPDQDIPWKKVKVYHMDSFEPPSVMHEVDGEIKQCIRKCVDHLRDNCNANMFKYKFPALGQSIEMGTTWLSQMSDLKDLFDPQISQCVLMECTKKCLSAPKYTLQQAICSTMLNKQMFIPKKLNAAYKEALEYEERRLKLALLENGIFLYPTVPFAALQHGKPLLKVDAMWYNMIFNIMGLPVTHIPLGLNKDGLPIGVSVVTGENNDYLCFKVAEELEKHFGGWVAPF